MHGVSSAEHCGPAALLPGKPIELSLLADRAIGTIAEIADIEL